MAKFTLLFGILTVGLGCIVPSSFAGLATVQFAGVVTSVSPSAQAVFTSGDTFSGSFTYDEDEPHGGPSFAATGQYGLGLTEFTISFTDSGNNTYYSATKTSDFFANNLEVSDAAFDRVSIAVSGLPNPPGLTSGRLQIDFSDLSTPQAGTSLGSEDLPSPIPFASLTNQAGTWQLPNFLNRVGLNVTSASMVAAVPDPAWTSISVDASGQVDLMLETVSGQQYQIDHSPDGTNWTPWQTVTATGASTPLTNNPGAGVTVRLYRATRL